MRATKNGFWHQKTHNLTFSQIHIKISRCFGIPCTVPTGKLCNHFQIVIANPDKPVPKRFTRFDFLVHFFTQCALPSKHLPPGLTYQAALLYGPHTHASISKGFVNIHNLRGELSDIPNAFSNLCRNFR